jgi:hypothetical protein
MGSKSNGDVEVMAPHAFGALLSRFAIYVYLGSEIRISLVFLFFSKSKFLGCPGFPYTLLVCV